MKISREISRREAAKPQLTAQGGTTIEAAGAPGEVGVVRLCREDVIETAMNAIAGNGGAAGVDGQTPAVYLRGDEDRIQWRDQLLQQLRTKTYKPSPVRRVWIPKADGKLRPLGIPTVTDRVVQAAMVLILMAIYEADFHRQSYAYRPKRNVHQALNAISAA
jgi:RNA-directed DNA polymerase